MISVYDYDGTVLGSLTVDTVYWTNTLGDARGDLLVVGAIFTNESDELKVLHDLIQIGAGVERCTTGLCDSD